MTDSSIEGVSVTELRALPSDEFDTLITMDSPVFQPWCRRGRCAAERPNRQAAALKFFVRGIALLLAATPFALVAWLGCSGWRFLDGRLAIFGYVLFGLGASLSALNFYLAFLRYPLHLARAGTKENYVWSSPIPLLGALVVPGLALLPLSTWSNWLAAALLLVDTGGIHWFVFATWRDRSFWNQESAA